METQNPAKVLKERIQQEELDRQAALENCAPPNTLQEAINASTVGENIGEDTPTAVVTVEAEKRGRGRPSEYSEEEADNICAWIAEGKSLRSYTRATGRDLTTIYRWLREYGDFHKRYARAHDDRADTLADELLDIADEAASGTLEEIQAAKLRIDTRKWISAKLRPQKWGDTPVPQQKTNVVFNIGLKQPPQLVRSHTVVPTIDVQAAPVLGGRPDTESGA